MIKGYMKNIFTTANSTFAGTEIAQTWSALFAFERIFQEYKPDIIIEIGTYLGALTHFFSLHCLNVYSYDNLNRKIKKYSNINYIVKDVFDTQTITEISNLISSLNKKILLFCDGGNKAKEFNIYAPYIKKGDLIFVHDWTLAIKIDDIKETINKYNLKPYKHKFCNDWKTYMRGWSK